MLTAKGSGLIKKLIKNKIKIWLVLPELIYQKIKGAK
jgi:hypothetical protein